MTLNVQPGFLWNDSTWNPSMISTALWLDAADTSTVTLVSGAVSQWNDKSGNNRHVSQATPSERPIVSSTQLNGRNVLQFDGNEDSLINSAVGLPVGSSSRTAILVYQPLRTTAINTLISQGNTNTTGAWFALQAREGSADPYFAGFSADVSTGGSVTTATKIASAAYDGTTVSLFRNGTAFNSAARSLNTTGDIFRVGASFGVERAQALIAEIVFLSTAVSLDNRQKLEGYLAHKWGLEANLPVGHPYKTTGPTP